jgi:hypothetical protein
MSNPRGLCIDCNYSLAGIDSTRCPECGRPFNPADTGSMNMTGPITPVERWLLRPSALLFPGSCVAILGVTFLCLWTIPWTEVGVAGSLVLLAFATSVCAVLYAPRKLLRSWVVRRHDLPPKMTTVDDAVVYRLKNVTITAALLLITRLPFWLLFLVSLPSLARVAEHEYRDVLDGAPRPHDVWVGAFPVKYIRVTPLGVTFDVSHGLTLHYRPGRAEPTYQPFFKNWYFDD